MPTIDELKGIPGDCFCNTYDVVMEGGLEDKYEPLTDRIKYKIKDVTLHLKHISRKNLSSDEDFYNARMACVYGVLSWLEGHDWIPRSALTSVREGNVAVIYKPNRLNSSVDDEQPSSYTELYAYYRRKLLPLPATGVLF